jgi:uncharacterized metal-binding protein
MYHLERSGGNGRPSGAILRGGKKLLTIDGCVHSAANRCQNGAQMCRDSSLEVKAII